jgi:hypothetical protein
MGDGGKPWSAPVPAASSAAAGGASALLLRLLLPQPMLLPRPLVPPGLGEGGGSSRRCRRCLGDDDDDVNACAAPAAPAEARRPAAGALAASGPPAGGVWVQQRSAQRMHATRGADGVCHSAAAGDTRCGDDRAPRRLAHTTPAASHAANSIRPPQPAGTTTPCPTSREPERQQPCKVGICAGAAAAVVLAQGAGDQAAGPSLLKVGCGVGGRHHCVDGPPAGGVCGRLSHGCCRVICATLSRRKHTRLVGLVEEGWLL